MQPTHPLATLGNLILLCSLGLAVALGVSREPAIPSILFASAAFTLGYALVRLPQIRGLFQTDGIKSVMALVYVWVGGCIPAAIFYGVGRLFA
jgi:hypothetical protein